MLSWTFFERPACKASCIIRTSQEGPLLALWMPLLQSPPPSVSSGPGHRSVHACSLIYIHSLPISGPIQRPIPTLSSQRQCGEIKANPPEVARAAHQRAPSWSPANRSKCISMFLCGVYPSITVIGSASLAACMATPRSLGPREHHCDAETLIETCIIPLSYCVS